jgi:hypothetical protein
MSAQQMDKEWHIDCVDVAGRPRPLLLRVDAPHVILTTPPGESARMTWTRAEELSRLLHTLAGQALAAVSTPEPTV